MVYDNENWDVTCMVLHLWKMGSSSWLFGPLALTRLYLKYPSDHLHLDLHTQVLRSLIGVLYENWHSLRLCRLGPLGDSFWHWPANCETLFLNRWSWVCPYMLAVLISKLVSARRPLHWIERGGSFCLFLCSDVFLKTVEAFCLIFNFNIAMNIFGWKGGW